MSKTEISVYTDHDTAEGVLDYQKEHSLKKSEAAEKLIKIGLEHTNGGLLTDLYRELGKVCLVVGLVVGALATESAAALELPLLYYAFMFVGAGLVALMFDAYDVSVLSWLGSRRADSSTAESPR